MAPYISSSLIDVIAAEARVSPLTVTRHVLGLPCRSHIMQAALDDALARHGVKPVYAPAQDGGAK